MPQNRRFRFGSLTNVAEESSLPSVGERQREGANIGEYGALGDHNRHPHPDPLPSRERERSQTRRAMGRALSLRFAAFLLLIRIISSRHSTRPTSPRPGQPADSRRPTADSPQNKRRDGGRLPSASRRSECRRHWRASAPQQAPRAGMWRRSYGVIIADKKVFVKRVAADRVDLRRADRRTGRCAVTAPS